MGSNDITTKPSAWHMVRWDPPDIPQTKELADFIRGQQADPDNYPKEKDAIFEWKLRRNPVHPGFASAMVAGDKEEIVSLCTITPRHLWIDGTVTGWAEIGDTFTDKSYVRKGMFGNLVNETRQRAQEAGSRIIYGLPNDQSAPGYINKLDFPVKKNISLMNQTLILSSRAIAWWMQARRGADTWWIPFAKTLLENPVSEAVSRKTVQLSTPNPQTDGIAVREELAFGPEYDALWSRVRESIPVAQVRDAKYLHWRYIENPFPFRTFVAVRNNRLEGYIVTLMRDHEGDEPRRMYLIDWLFLPEESDSIGGNLLHSVIISAHHEEACLVTALAPKESPVALPWRRFRFIQRPWSKPLIIHCNEEGSRLIYGDSPWHFTLGDTDAF